MIYLYYGSDREKVLSSANEKLVGLKAKQPEAQVIHFETSANNAESAKALGASVSFFGETYIIVLRYFAETATGRDLLTSLLTSLSSSPYDVIIIDGALTKDVLDKAEELKCKISKINKVEPSGYAGAREIKPTHPIFASYNIYRFSDAFGERDKKKLWLEYNTALTAGLPAEELFWKLVWQLRQMLTVSKMTSTDKTEMKPYSITKAKSFLKNYKPNELAALSEKLTIIYHECRRGTTDFETSVERLTLEV